MLAFIAMGRVLEAHDARHHARHISRKAHDEKASNRLGVNYTRDQLLVSHRAEMRAEMSLERKLSAEKHFTKLYRTFGEMHPDRVGELDALLAQQIEQQVQTFQARKEIQHEADKASRKARTGALRHQRNPYCYDEQGNKLPGAFKPKP